jgi:betaine-aldehyde dehydrogenase
MAPEQHAEIAPVEAVEPPNGGWQLVYGGESHEPVNGGRLDVYSPIDGSLLGTIPNADAEDVDRAVEAARLAAKDWGKTAPSERVAALEALGKRLAEESERLAWLDTVDGGLPINVSRRELGGVGGLARGAYAAAEIKGDTFQEVRGLWGFTRREPWGVTASLLAFNHPGAFCVGAMVAPLATGNSVIIKPAERTSLSALAIGVIAQEVLPPGLVNIITGDGATAGNAIAGHPGIPRVSLVGSVNSGRAVLAAASNYIKHVQLELGGKNPLLVLPDADIDLAVRMAVSGMNLRTTAGQSCESGSRVLVHSSLYEDFTSRLIKDVETIRVGDPRDPETEMGPMAFKQHFERVTGYIQIGLAEGAKLLSGGGVPKGLERGYFVEPTVFGEVTRSMRIANEEIFGPVISVMRWDDRDELVNIANSVEYGLCARIACGSVGEGLELAREIQAGKIWINEALGMPERFPTGGYKMSGLGKRGDLEALRSFTQEKAITVRI